MHIDFACIRCGCQTTRHHTARSRMCESCMWEHRQEARRATADVTNEIKRGHMKRATEHACVDCGATARDWDHRDYTKPLEVEPVCKPCNTRRGTAYDSVYRPVGAPPVVPVVRLDYRARGLRRATHATG
jgi:hypothetical protein